MDFFEKHPFFKNKPNGTNTDFDGLAAISYQLLSASYSMDTYIPADSSLFVFLYGKGISEWFNTKDESLYQEKFVQNLSALFTVAR